MCTWNVCSDRFKKAHTIKTWWITEHTFFTSSLNDVVLRHFRTLTKKRYAILSHAIKLFYWTFNNLIWKTPKALVVFGIWQTLWYLIVSSEKNILRVIDCFWLECKWLTVQCFLRKKERSKWHLVYPVHFMVSLPSYHANVTSKLIEFLKNHTFCTF